MEPDAQRDTLISLQEVTAVGLTEIADCRYPMEPRYIGGLPVGDENRLDTSSEYGSCLDS
jgi:hypothetical protein